MVPFFWIFVTFYLVYFFSSYGLDLLNLAHLKKHQGQIPELFKSYVDEANYHKTQEYTRAKTHYLWANRAFDALILWGLLLSGAFAEADVWLGHYFSGYLHSLMYLFFFAGIFYALGLPFTLYYQFVLEERFGFNKTTAKTFIVDQIKTLLLSVSIGAPLLLLILWLIKTSGPYWWVWGWLAILFVQFLVAALFPVLLAPIFYKFTPLAEGELKQKIIAIAQKIKFKMSGIFTIDGSRRSGHSNAFFAGLGKTRRIVLFDTLVTQLTTDELVAVLAHEMGHNIKKHIRNGLILSSFTSLLGFYVLALLLNHLPFYLSFGIPAPSIHIGFLLFGLFYSSVTFPFEPFFNWISRKHEYEADQFSVEVTQDKSSMTQSLIKLSKDNLSNLTPHPWYSFFHYSHPTTLERAEAIENLKN